MRGQLSELKAWGGQNYLLLLYSAPILSSDQFWGIFLVETLFQKLWPLLYYRAESDLRLTKNIKCKFYNSLFDRPLQLHPVQKPRLGPVRGVLFQMAVFRLLERWSDPDHTGWSVWRGQGRITKHGSVDHRNATNFDADSRNSNAVGVSKHRLILKSGNIFPRRLK